MVPMRLLRSRLFRFACALTFSSVGCTGNSKQTSDAGGSGGAPGDVPAADAGAEHVADAPAPGAEVGKDAAAAGGPEVAALCPGLDKFGDYAPIVAGAAPFPDGVELLVATGGPKAMVVTDSELYWASDQVIHRMTLADGVDKTILDRSTYDNTISDLALDTSNLYFTEIGLSNEYRVAKMSLDGSGTPVTLGGNNSPWYIAVAGDYVYYYDANVREIDRVPTAGGSIVTLVRDVDPDSFCLADGHIYFKDQVTPTADALLSISVDAQASPPIDGGTDGGANGLVTLATNNRGFSAPCYADGNLYYGDGDNLMKMPAAGGTAKVLVGLPAGSWLSTIATAGGQLYWATGATSPSYCSDIVRAAMDGSGQTTIVHAIEAPDSFALNATHLFILTRGGQILRVTRTGTPSGAGGAGGNGGAGGSGGAGGTPGANADAGGQAFTQMRFMQVWLNGGQKATFDYWGALDAGGWYSLVRGLGYGELTDFIQVPNGKGLNTNIWFVPTGDDPNDYYLSMEDSMNFKIEESDTGKHTVFSFFVGSPSYWSHVMVADADPKLAPPDGWAYVAFSTYAIAGAYPVMDYGSSAGCIDRSKQNYYQPMSPGAYQFSLYTGDQTNCGGSVIATTPSVQVANGEVWMLFAMGDATNGYALKPVKMDRN